MSSDQLNMLMHGMLFYQKQNNIKSKCIVNAQFFYDSVVQTIKMQKLEGNVEIKAAIVIGYIDNAEHTESKPYLVTKHMVVVYKDKIYDPSYEIYSLKNKTYFFTLGDYNQHNNNNNNYLPKFDKKHMKQFIAFVKQSAEMMHPNKLCYNKHYYKQADFIDKFGSFIGL
jgi:hypothetical protein